MKKMAMLCCALLSASLLRAATVTQTVVRQLWPWSTKVDIGFVLTGEPEVNYDVQLKISDAKGEIHVYANSLTGERSNIKPGEHHIFWEPTLSGVTNLAAMAALKFELTAKDSLGKKYMIVDISAGDADNAEFPVSYLDEPPAGGFNTDEYKLNKIALRRIPAGMYLMGSPADEYGHLDARDSNDFLTETQVPVLLTNDFYVGIFPVTFHQVTNVSPAILASYNGYSSAQQLKARSDPRRPATFISVDRLFGASATVPYLDNAEPDTFFGKLRARTASVALPADYEFSILSEAQWEYACRAGTTSALNSGEECGVNMGANDQDKNVDKVGLTSTCEGKKGGYLSWYGGLNVNVGCTDYQPNAWGLYDMHGLVEEWCCNGWVPSRGTELLIEPLPTYSTTYLVLKGGSVNYSPVRARSASGHFRNRDWGELVGMGFRLALVHKRR